MSERYSAGVATAYGAALRGGYTGTYNDFCNDIAKLGDITEELGNISAEATTLEAGSSATASYNDGVFAFGIPRGNTGAQGERGETGAKGDKGDTGETGATGATGNGIASIAKTATVGLVDTYTITFTDGTTSTFTVTNGAEAIDTTLSIAGRAADAKATGDEISDLKSEVSQLDSTVNGEDIPITFIANEYINSSNGAFVPYNGWSRSNLIDCSMVDSIIYTNTGRASAYNAFYDENGEFISAFSIQQTQTGNYPKPANAKYFAYSNYTADMGLFTWVNKPAPQGGLVEDVGNLDERVTALESSQGSIPEIILPPYAVAVVGHEFNMYTENVVICDNINSYIWEWKMLPYATQYNQYDDRFSVIPTVGSERTYTLSLTCIDKTTGETITSASMSLVVVSDTAITGKKMLMIGDSLTASGYSAYEIESVLSENGVESLGTLTATPWIGNVQKSVNMEGRGGWGAYDYMHTASKNDNTNAFLNPSTNLFDFSYYMAQQGYSGVDIVLLNLGTNGTDNIQRDVEAMGQIITSIHSYNANIPVVVHLTPPPATQNGWTYINHGAGAEEFRLKTLAMVKAQIEAFGNKQSEKTYISCVYGCLDRYHDFAYKEVAVSQRNPFTVTRQIQNVHPASYGYYKFADVYWGMIEHLLT